MHDSIPLIGAAYIFHIIKNHPFVDGNKRTGIAGCLIFLHDNGSYIDQAQDQMFDIAKKVAVSQLSKEEVAQILNILVERSDKL